MDLRIKHDGRYITWRGVTYDTDNLAALVEFQVERLEWMQARWYRGYLVRGLKHARRAIGRGT